MNTIKGRFTNFYHDTTIWSAVQQMVSGVERPSMGEAVDEIVATLQINDTWVYWSTLVEMDGPGGNPIVLTIDLQAHADDAMRRAAEETRKAKAAPPPRALREAMPAGGRDEVRKSSSGRRVA